MVSLSPSGMVGLAPKWVRMSPNGTNPGLFYFGSVNQIVLKSDVKKNTKKPDSVSFVPTSADHSEVHRELSDLRERRSRR